MIMKYFLTLASVAGSAFAQYATSSFTDKSTGKAITYQAWTDPTWNITIGFSFPNNPNATEFIGLISFPASYSYAGVSIGPEGMTNGLLLGAWGLGKEPGIISPRYTQEYSLPPLYTGPQISIIKTSTTNATATTLNFVCSNCTSWPGGSLDPTSTSVFMSHAVATAAALVETPTSVNSTLGAHNPDDINFFTADLAAAQTPEYEEVIQYLTERNLLEKENLSAKKAW